MADIKKYKLLHDVQGIEYSSDGNNKQVTYKKGDVVYGVMYYEGGDLVWVNNSGIFDDNNPSLAISMAYLQLTDEPVKEGTGNEIDDVSAAADTDDKYAFWNEKYELPLFKLFIGGVGLWALGYFIGRWTCGSKNVKVKTT